MNPGPLTSLFEIIDRSIVPERWRQHKTWRTQHQTTQQWDEGLAHYLSRVKRTETLAARRATLVKLVTYGLAAIEDLDAHDRTAAPQPVRQFDPEESLR